MCLLHAEDLTVDLTREYMGGMHQSCINNSLFSIAMRLCEVIPTCGFWENSAFFLQFPLISFPRWTVPGVRRTRQGWGMCWQNSSMLLRLVLSCIPAVMALDQANGLCDVLSHPNYQMYIIHIQNQVHTYIHYQMWKKQDFPVRRMIYKWSIFYISFTLGSLWIMEISHETLRWICNTYDIFWWMGIWMDIV